VRKQATKARNLKYDFLVKG